MVQFLLANGAVISGPFPREHPLEIATNIWSSCDKQATVIFAGLLFEAGAGIYVEDCESNTYYVAANTNSKELLNLLARYSDRNHSESWRQAICIAACSEAWGWVRRRGLYQCTY